MYFFLHKFLYITHVIEYKLCNSVRINQSIFLGSFLKYGLNITSEDYNNCATSLIRLSHYSSDVTNWYCEKLRHKYCCPSLLSKSQSKPLAHIPLKDWDSHFNTRRSVSFNPRLFFFFMAVGSGLCVKLTRWSGTGLGFVVVYKGWLVVSHSLVILVIHS